MVLISSLATGGAERVTVSFLRRLAEQGRGATVCTLTSRDDGSLAGELARAGVVRRDLGARRLADPGALMRLIALLKRERIGLVHAHGQDASILGAAACAAARVPFIITRHVLEEPATNWRQRLRARAALAAFRRADVAVAVSGATADRLASLARLPRASVTVIHNGIDVARFARPELGARGRELRKSLGLADTDYLLLVPAVLRAGKGHDVLLAALPAILAGAPGVRLIFAGGGEREGALRALARVHGEAVRFLGPRDDIPELMAMSDLVVLPSQAEALPTALMEAAAAGRPVVATRVGGTADVVQDKQTGLLVPPNDPDALARAVLALAGDRRMAEAFGDKGRRVAHQRFGLDGQVDKTLELWADTARRGRR